MFHEKTTKVEFTKDHEFKMLHEVFFAVGTHAEYNCKSKRSQRYRAAKSVMHEVDIKIKSMFVFQIICHAYLVSIINQNLFRIFYYLNFDSLFKLYNHDFLNDMVVMGNIGSREMEMIDNLKRKVSSYLV